MTGLAGVHAVAAYNQVSWMGAVTRDPSGPLPILPVLALSGARPGSPRRSRGSCCSRARAHFLHIATTSGVARLGEEHRPPRLAGVTVRRGGASTAVHPAAKRLELSRLRHPLQRGVHSGPRLTDRGHHVLKRPLLVVGEQGAQSSLHLALPRRTRHYTRRTRTTGLVVANTAARSEQLSKLPLELSVDLFVTLIGDSDEFANTIRNTHASSVARGPVGLQESDARRVFGSSSRARPERMSG